MTQVALLSFSITTNTMLVSQPLPAWSRSALLTGFGDRSGRAIRGTGRQCRSQLSRIDNSGLEMSARFKATELGLLLTVDDGDAEYPLLIDPVVQQTYLKASNPNHGDKFGQSIDVSGDTIVVGAGSEDSQATGVNRDAANNGAVSAGAAYVFTRSAGIWTQEGYLKASNTDAADRFGDDLAIDGDRIVVGATGEQSTAIGVDGNQGNGSSWQLGAAYVFRRVDSVWTQEAYLKPSFQHPSVYSGGFGYAVDISGDTIVVGRPWEISAATGVNGDQTDASAVESGAAYIFVRDAGVWSQQAYLKASNTDPWDEFGSSVTISGDTVVVGAIFEDGGGSGVNSEQILNKAFASGAAYVFVRNSVTWTHQAYLKALVPYQNAFFGWALDIHGDLLAIGAAFERGGSAGVNGGQSDVSGSQVGAAYLLVRTGGNWAHTDYLKASNPDNGDQFGWDLSSDSDTLVVGAPGEGSIDGGVNGDQNNNVFPSSGAAYVLDVIPSEPGSAYCFGDGTEGPCPCMAYGEPGTGCASSDGNGVKLAGSGTASISNDSLNLIATGVPENKPGLILRAAN